nr:HEAT repeat domain-containing protein [Rippkaea orientalis]
MLEESKNLQSFFAQKSNINSTLIKENQEKSIPILIELRYYQTSILDLILQFLQRHDLIIDSNTLEIFLLENNDFTLLLLFDGINELPSEVAIRMLFDALVKHSDKYIRSEAAEALANIATESTLTSLFNALKNPNFVTANNGDTFYQAYSAISTIQDKLKYYQPQKLMTQPQVYISYNWQEDSNEMANQLVQAFAHKGIEIIR